MMSNAIVMALAPVFFVLLLGYAAGKFHIVDNHHVDGFNALVMNFALPASLFAATASASRSQMIEQASFKLDWQVVAATAASDVIRPLLAVGVVYAIPISSGAAKTAILLAAVPSGFFGILFAVNYRLDYATAGSMVIASTAFSIVTMAIAIAVLFSH
jgi:malonate transporter